MTAKTKSQPAAPKQPAYRLYRVTGDGQNAIWTPLGAAWTHKDGKGFNIACDAVPLQGRIVMRVFEPREQRQAQGGQQ